MKEKKNEECLAIQGDSTKEINSVFVIRTVEDLESFEKSRAGTYVFRR